MSRYSGFNFQEEYLSEEGDRGGYFRRAAPAIRDNPIFGFGLNNWSYWISNRYAAEANYYEFDTYSSTRNPPERPNQAPPAHNLYLLTVAELGWPGLVIFLALIGRWLIITGNVLISRDDDIIARFRVGAFLSLCAVLMQSWTEWEFRVTSMFFLCHIVVGVAAVLYWHRPGNGLRSVRRA